ncbi:MAG: hypothetical protein ACJ790_00525 [Myxococcaceae bacterium]
MSDTLCPSCQKPLGNAREFCPSCLAEVRLGPSTGPAPEPPPAPSEAAPVAAPVAAVARPCPKHPDRPTIGTCERCGNFICVVCAPEFAWAPDRPCLSCEHVMDRTEAPSRIQRSLFAAGVIGVLEGALVLLATFTASLGVGLVFSFPLFVFGGLMMIFRKNWIAYTLAVFQLFEAPLLGWPSIRWIVVCLLPDVFVLAMVQDAARISEKALEATRSPSAQ